ncbi:MAG TPA: TRAP transporter small permease subunit, partial [Magnetospirillaceae bacterium]|nr:TRAP transporter small permease subunit [Magnetospirillaceae bacterium]
MGEGTGCAALDRVSRAVDTLASAFCAVLFGAMTVSVLLGVFFRYVVNLPLAWTEEVSRYLMIWGASIGITLGIRAD